MYNELSTSSIIQPVWQQAIVDSQPTSPVWARTCTDTIHNVWKRRRVNVFTKLGTHAYTVQEHKLFQEMAVRCVKIDLIRLLIRVCIWFRLFLPECKLWGCEPCNRNDTHSSTMVVNSFWFIWTQKLFTFKIYRGIRPCYKYGYNLRGH